MAIGDISDFRACENGDSVLGDLKARALMLGFDAVAIIDLQDLSVSGQTGIRWTVVDIDMDRGDSSGLPLDSACRAARRRVAPFRWPELHLGADCFGSLKLLQLLIPDLDQACVGTIPIHGPGGCMACLHVAARGTARQFEDLFHQRAHDLQAMAIEAVQRLIELGVDEGIGTRLTERQWDVLHWVVQGKTNWEIGQILGISPDTVRQHVMHIAGALKVRNRVQVAATAVARGMCTPSFGNLIAATKPH